MNDTCNHDNDLEKIITEVKRDVIGQDSAVEQVCTLIDIGKKRSELLEECEVEASCRPQFCSALLIGTSGSGKTYMLKNIAAHEDMIFWEIDATTLTGEGWSGASLSTYWGMLGKKMEEEPYKLALIYIDEIDKILKDNGCPGSAKFDLLKPLEGGLLKGEFEHKLFEINFDRCVVIMSGAFTDIDNCRAKKKASIGFKGALKDKGVKREEVSRDDLIAWGAPRELVGRFSLILNLNELQCHDYKEIIDTQITNKYSALLQNFELKVSDEAAEFLANEAMDKNLGARYINQCINDVFARQVWRSVTSDPQQGGSITLVMNEGKLDFKVRGGNCGISKPLIKKKPKVDRSSFWASVIREKVDNVGIPKDGSMNKEVLVDDVFKYMSVLKHESKNVFVDNDVQRVYNDYSSAELDLLYCLICDLKYYFDETFYNFNELKTMFGLCYVNNEGVSPLECAFEETFMERDIYRNNREADFVVFRGQVYGIYATKAKTIAGRSVEDFRDKQAVTHIKEDVLMAKAYHEFIVYPQSERDEAVKMLAWRLI